MSSEKTTIASTLSWQDEATFELEIKIPASKVEQARQEVVKELAKTAKLDGFRKGKAPLKLIEEKVDPNLLLQKIVEKTVPAAYLEAIKQHNLTPIIEPRITLQKAKMGEDWIIKAVSSQAPKVELNNYKEEVRKLNAQRRIWTPEKGVGKEEEKDKEERFQKIIEVLLKKIKVKVPQLILEKEVEDRLISLIDQLQKTGITLDQFLARTGRTIEQLKKEYQKQAEERWKLEFILSKIADEEKIQVSEEELKEIAKNKSASKEFNPYLLAQLLRRQKTLEYLANL